MPRLRNTTKTFEQYLGEGRSYSRSLERLYSDDGASFGVITAETAAGNITITNQASLNGQWSGYIRADSVGQATIILKGESPNNADPYISRFKINVLDPEAC